MVVAVPPDRLAELAGALRAATASSWPTSARSPATAASSCATAARVVARPRHRVPPRRPAAAADGRRRCRRPTARPGSRTVADPAATLLALLAHRNIASKAATIHRYDHEIGGGTVVRPLVGVAADGPGDGVVLADPRDTHGLAIGIGVNPWYGLHDPEAMAHAVVDEAIRNVVAVGADPDRVALLDNFSWGDPRRPSTLGELVAAVARLPRRRARPRRAVRVGQGLAEQRVHRRRRPAPRRAADARDHRRRPRARRRPLRHGRARPPPGNVAAAARRARGPSSPAATSTSCSARPVDVGAGAAARSRRARPATAGCTRAIRAGLVQSCHDVSEGGLAVALAELCIAGRLGVDDRRAPPRRPGHRAVRRVDRAARRRGRARTTSTTFLADRSARRHRPRHRHRRAASLAPRPASAPRPPSTDAASTGRSPGDGASRWRPDEPAGRRIVVAGPGTNRDTRRRARARPRRRRADRRARRRAGRATRAARRRPASSSSPAGSATATPSAPGGCSPSTSPPPTAAGSASGCAAFVAGGRPVDRHLQRLPGAHPHRPAARRARPQRRRPLRLPLGARCAAEPASRCIWTDRPRRRRRTARSPTARAATCTPTPTALAAAGQVALRYAGGNPNGSVADIAGVCDATGVVLGLMPHPENHVAAPPAPAPPPRPDDDRARSGCACSKRRCAMSSERSRPMRRRSSTSTCRCPTAATARCGSPTRCGDDHRLFVTTDRLSAFDRIIAGVPVQGPGAQPAGGVVVRPHRRRRRQPRRRRARPQRARRPGGRRRCRSRSSCAATSPASRRRRCGSRTPPAPARSTATTSPTACAKNTALPEPLVTPTTKPPAGSTVHDEPLTWAEVVERGLVDAEPLGAGARRRPRAVPPRPGGRRRGRADPRRHQVRVRPRPPTASCC